jgi:hypothetical protein
MQRESTTNDIDLRASTSLQASRRPFSSIDTHNEKPVETGSPHAILMQHRGVIEYRTDGWDRAGV